MESQLHLVETEHGLEVLLDRSISEKDGFGENEYQKVVQEISDRTRSDVSNMEIFKEYVKSVDPTSSFFERSVLLIPHPRRTFKQYVRSSCVEESQASSQQVTATAHSIYEVFEALPLSVLRCPTLNFHTFFTYRLRSLRQTALQIDYPDSHAEEWCRLLRFSLRYHCISKAVFGRNGLQRTLETIAAETHPCSPNKLTDQLAQVDEVYSPFLNDMHLQSCIGQALSLAKALGSCHATFLPVMMDLILEAMGFLMLLLILTRNHQQALMAHYRFLQLESKHRDLLQARPLYGQYQRIWNMRSACKRA